MNGVMPMMILFFLKLALASGYYNIYYQQKKSRRRCNTSTKRQTGLSERGTDRDSYAMLVVPPAAAYSGNRGGQEIFQFLLLLKCQWVEVGPADDIREVVIDRKVNILSKTEIEPSGI